MRLAALQPAISRVTAVLWVGLGMLLALYVFGGAFFTLPCLLIGLWLALRPNGWFATKASITFSVLLAIVSVAILDSTLAWSGGARLVPVSMVLVVVTVALAASSLLAGLAAWRYDQQERSDILMTDG